MAVFFSQEGDNADEPLAITFDDEAKVLLAEAGDDPARASRPGWVVHPGGAYRAVDLAAEHFEPVNDPAQGQYDVSFSRVGPGKGSYVREQGFFSRTFRYVGPGMGDWVPRILYPLPRAHRLLSLWTHLRATQALRIEGEAAMSHLDRNTLSPLDDGDNAAFAGKIGLLLEEHRLAWPLPAGTVAFSAIGRAVQRGFAAMARTTEAEDNRRWGLPLNDVRGQERTFEVDGRYRPHPEHLFAFDVGWFDRDTSDVQSAHRAWRVGARWRTDAAGWPSLNISVEQIRARTRPPKHAPSRGVVRRGYAEVRYPVWYAVPSVNVEGESEERVRGDGLKEGARYGEWAAEIATRGIEAFAFSGGVEQRVDQRYDTLLTAWADRQRALTHTWRAAVREWRGLSLNAEYTWRRRTGPAVGAANIADVADVDLRYDPWDGLMRHAIRYRVSATRTARRERLYLYVGAGRGEYAPKDPDDRRAVLGDEDVLLVPSGDPSASYVLRYRDTGQFRPTMTLDASWQMTLDLARAWRGAPDPRSNRRRPLWQRLLRIVAMETALQVGETDTARTRELYLVQFWTFRKPGRSPTVRGTWSLIHDVLLWPHARRGDLRLRVRSSEEYDASLLGQAGVPDVRKRREVSLRGRVRFPSARADWSGELSVQRESRSGGRFDYRARRVRFDQTWSYHPTLFTEWVLRTESGIASDPTPDAAIAGDPARPLRAVLLAVEPSIRRAWGNRGMVRLSAQWSGVFAENLQQGRALPIRLLEGRNAGHNLRWSALVSYRLSSLVTASFTYSGRKTPDRPLTHTGRMEVRAIF